MWLPLSRLAAPDLGPVALMRLTEVKDADEVLTGHDRKDIVAEEKLDGWKTQVIKDGGKVHIFSRRGEEVTENFPAIAKAVTDLPDGTLIEGELVYWDKGKQDVTKVTSLAGSAAEKALEKAKDLPGKMRLHLYDILWHKGKNVTDEPFSKRRELLGSVVKISDTVVLTKQYPFSEWQEAMNKAVESGGEGIVLKLKDSKYHWKPAGESEPKPKDVMWKYKGGAGKHGSDDYVVYGTNKSPTGQLMAQFGQYLKGKLYAVSEIGNFSAENETEISRRLQKGLFVIEIGFQERVPGGLRHQKFLRFRDDKQPKDATMHEFHVEHIDEFEPAELERKAMYALAGSNPDAAELVTMLERAVGKPAPASSVKTGPTSIGVVGNVDGDKMFRIMSKLESNGRTDVVGDAGTSFGPTQMHGPYFLSRLSRMPGAEAASGMSPEEMRGLSVGWVDALKKLSGTRIWKEIPVDQDAAKQLPLIRRPERTFARRPDMVVERKGGRFFGRVFDTDALRALGFKVDSAVFRRAMSKAYSEYITDNVAKSLLAQAYVAEAAPLAFQKFKRQFNSASIRKNKALSSLISKASVDDFKSRIDAVVKAIEKSGYDTTTPGAFSVYHLIMVANGSGVGRVQQFLLNRKAFAPGHLGYLHSTKVTKALNALRQTDPDLAGIVNILLAERSGNGMAGFPDKKDMRIAISLLDVSEPITRLAALLSITAGRPAGPPRSPGELAAEQARNIMSAVERWLNYEHLERTILRDAGLTLMRIDRDSKPPKLLLWTTGDIERLQRLLPKKMWGMPVVLYADTPRMTAELPIVDWSTEEPTPVNVEARMPVNLYSQYVYLLKKVRKELKHMYRQVPEDSLRRTVFLHVAEQLGYTEEQLKKMIGEHVWLRFSHQVLPFSKFAMAENGTLAFPGQYAEDIKSGKLERTIRPADMPVEPEEVVTAITYSGSVICRIKILSKETMSLPRLEKAFGKHVARSLEHKFGAHRRFVVIRFSRFDTNEADDGLDEKKREETLIDKEGTTLTRGQIHDHYAKPAVRKLIMSRVKGKPVIIYLGVGKNEKILKRNHDGKPIVISSDDQKGKDSPNNYWYWVKRRMLSIHEVFGTKTDIGFVDLDLHGGYSLEKAKEYAKKLGPAIKEKYGVQAKTYQSGGSGLHVEFELNKEMAVDTLRSELRELLDKLNEDFEDATTSTVKGKGMRTDVSTLHNKGSLRVPGSLGETWGKVKRPLSQNTDDDYGNNNFGGKDSDTGPFGDGGAITPIPYQSSAPGQVGVWTASARRALFRAAGGR